MSASANHPRPPTDVLAFAQSVIQSETSAVAAMREALNEHFTHAAELLLQCEGAVVCSGVGKAGHVARKLSATLASTGTPSHFLSPGDALHGDAGVVRDSDVLLLCSYSGESQELVDLLSLIKRLGNRIVAITSGTHSTLGKHADITLTMGKVAEACPLGLAPSATTTAMLALGDALALSVMKLRDFTSEQFAVFHPAGALGRKLLRVDQAMSFRADENLPLAPQGMTVREVLAHVSNIKRRSGAVILVDDDGKIAGLFTDGDLRRALTTGGQDVLDRPIRELMTVDPKRIAGDKLASEAMSLLHQYRFDELPVVDADDRPIGLIDVQDIVVLKALDESAGG